MGGGLETLQVCLDVALGGEFRRVGRIHCHILFKVGMDAELVFGGTSGVGE